jgi:methyl-accepting chemotaxis protein
MKNWTIGKRIVIMASTLCILNVLITAWSIQNLSVIQKQGQTISEKNLPGVIHASTMNYLPMINMVRLYRLLETDDPAERKRIEQATLEDTKKFLAADEIYKSTLHTEEEFKQFEALAKVHEKYLGLRAKYLSLLDTDKAQARQILTVDMVAALTDFSNNTLAIVQQNADQGETSGKTLVSVVKSSFVSLGIAGGISIILGIVLAVFTIRSTNSVLSRLAAALSDVANNVSNAASQVTGASQSLAKGASEQAASLEETSASIEEINSQSKRNTDNAETTRALAEDTRAATEQGNSRMREMSEAMNDIKTSSGNIANIIKTIDEIAFQTNILALNAAVEAARAGEAGAGFAVVAEEVRNLAQRSALAAKETAEKIDDSLKKSLKGVELSTRVSTELSEIGTKTIKMNDLVKEIATASKEQTEGLKQIASAMTQMDKVTQLNASGAEETAGTAEELQALSAKLLANVTDLLKLVGGQSKTQPAPTS